MRLKFQSLPMMQEHKDTTVGTLMPCGTSNNGRKYQIGSELKKDNDNSIVAEGKISRDGTSLETRPQVQDLVREAQTIPTEHQEKQREDRGRERAVKGEIMPITVVPPLLRHAP